MEPQHIGVIPGSGSGERGRGSGTGSGSGGRGRVSGWSGHASVGTSRIRRSRLSAQSTGTRLMPAFDDAAGDAGDGRVSRSSSSSSGGFEDATQGYNRHRKASQDSNLRRPLFGSYPTQDDEVIVMDGVLFDKTWALSSPRRSSSPNELGFVPSISPGSGGRGSYGFDRQISDGRGEPRLSQPMKRQSYEMETQIGQQVQGTSFYMPRPLTPPPTPPRGFPLQIGQQVQGTDFYMPLPLNPPPTPPRGFPLQIGQQVQGACFYMPCPLTPPPTPPGGFPLFPSSLPFVSDIIPAAPGGFPFPPPSLPVPGAGPPPAATAIASMTRGGSAPYFTPPPRATRTAASSRPPPGFNFAPHRRLDAAAPGFYPIRSPSPPPPPPPLPQAQQQRSEFSWPPKASVGVIARPARAPDSSAPKQPAPPLQPRQCLPSPDNAFTWPPTEEEDEFINDVLYGPSNRRRLPVFKSICPD